jgi:hypothetical protein
MGGCGRRGFRWGEGNLRVGTADGLLRTMVHSDRSTACVKYAIAARHSGSSEGRPNAGPQTCSSSTIAKPVIPEDPTLGMPSVTQLCALFETAIFSLNDDEGLFRRLGKFRSPVFPLNSLNLDGRSARDLLDIEQCNLHNYDVHVTRECQLGRQAGCAFLR